MHYIDSIIPGHLYEKFFFRIDVVYHQALFKIWSKAWTTGYFGMFILHLLITADLYFIVKDPFKPQKARNKYYWQIIFLFVLIFLIIAQDWSIESH